MPTVITANRLSDGAVVFLGNGFGWVASLQQAVVLAPHESADALARAKQDEARQIVVEPYAIDVTQDEKTIRAKLLREAIRAGGPTVRPDLRKP